MVTLCKAEVVNLADLMLPELREVLAVVKVETRGSF